MQSGKCILMCAGEFVPMEIDADRERGDTIIAVDGGLRHLEEMGICPDYLLGDFDSLYCSGSEVFREFRENRPDRIIRLPIEKDDTDTMYAVRFGLGMGYSVFNIYGAAGGRIDHTLANIQTLLFAAKNGARAFLFTDSYVMFVIGNETRHFHPGLPGMFSLFSLSDSCRATIKGMKYEADDLKLTSDYPIGTSNEFLTEEMAPEGADVEIRDGYALAVYTYDREKKIEG